MLFHDYLVCSRVSLEISHAAAAPVRTPSRLWLIWPTGTINLVPAKLGRSGPTLSFRDGVHINAWSGPAPSTGSGAYEEW